MDLSIYKKTFRLIIPCLFVLFVIAVSYFRVFDNFELSTLDFRFVLRPVKTAPADKVVIIEIGDDSVAKLGRFPFDRSYHALLINALSESGAKAIVFDVLFSAPQENDAELEQAISESGRTYLPLALDINNADKSDIVSAKGFASECLSGLASKAKGTGHINVVPDSDGKFRRLPLYVKYNDKLYPNMSLLVACDYLGIDRNDIKFLPGNNISCGKAVTIPLDERSEMIINYSGKWGKVFKHYSYVDVLQSYLASATGTKPVLDPNCFKDKICIVGLTTIGMDIHSTPFEPIYPGVGIHAEVFNSIVNKNFIARAHRWINTVILILLMSLTALIALMIKPVKGLISTALLASIFTITAILMFNIYGIWLDTVCPIFTVIMVYLWLTLYKYMSEWKMRLRQEHELDTARTIQESLLPKAIPDVIGAEISAAMFAARQVGGDMYEFIEFGKDKIGIMIGDVSGKGIPASLFMAMTLGKFRCFNTAETGPREVLSLLNANLVKESASNLFVTMFYAIFDLKAGSVNFANGGHLPLLHISSGKAPEFHDVSNGTPLGLIDGEYSEGSAGFKKWDVFVFYTDGITEAMNFRREMYEKERLSAVVEKNAHLPAESILAAIEKDVRHFEPKSTQHDDITVIVVKII